MAQIAPHPTLYIKPPVNIVMRTTWEPVDGLVGLDSGSMGQASGRKIQGAHCPSTLKKSTQGMHLEPGKREQQH